jgi:hypothetical protein
MHHKQGDRFSKSKTLLAWCSNNETTWAMHDVLKALPFMYCYLPKKQEVDFLFTAINCCVQLVVLESVLADWLAIPFSIAAQLSTYLDPCLPYVHRCTTLHLPRPMSTLLHRCTTLHLPRPMSTLRPFRAQLSNYLDPYLPYVQSLLQGPTSSPSSHSSPPSSSSCLTLVARWTRKCVHSRRALATTTTPSLHASLRPGLDIPSSKTVTDVLHRNIKNS